MSNRDDLLKSIADTIKDYRAGEIARPTPEHVDRWVRQFGEEVQLPLLSEMNHILDQTYFTKDFVSDWFAGLIRQEKIAGTDPCTFWQEANLLNIQQDGQSQAEILQLFGEGLKDQCGIDIETCGSLDGAFIYLDDALFSGGRVGGDLSKWIKEDAPDSATVHIIVIASHRLGEWQMTERLKKVAKEADKDIKIHSWASVRFENRFRYKDRSEVLWPAAIPEDDDLAAYMALEEKYPFQPRNAGGLLKNGIFSSEANRQLIEKELLLAGVKIRASCLNPKTVTRPLGFSFFGLGFGSTIVTFRNCPNNCPLAFWWGDPRTGFGGPLGNWYPLFERKTYSSGAKFYGFGF